MKINNDFFMDLAIKEAWKYQGLTYPNPAVGCCIVKNNNILAIKAHKSCGKPHAEVLALQTAFAKLRGDKEILKIKESHLIHDFLIKNHNNIFKNTHLYTTLEPCNHIGKTPACSQLIVALKIKKVFIGSKDAHSKGGIELLKQNNIKVKEGILSQKCDELIYPFFKSNKNQFVFFKYASTLNGVIGGGYISNKKSLKQVHKLRDKIDLLVIGGNTVRQDRPTLDARMCNGKAPDIFIYSKQKDFDKSIPLFNIRNRKVFISDDINKIKQYKYVMIEGVDTMMKQFEKYIDYYLVFLAPKLKQQSNIKCEIDFKILDINTSNKDIQIWGKEN